MYVFIYFFFLFPLMPVFVLICGDMSYRGNILLELVLIGIQNGRDLIETLAWMMAFSCSGICPNVESIVCVLCV